MKSNRFHILELRRFLQSRDFYITKTVKRKRWFELFSAIAGENKMVGGLRGAQVIHI